MSDEDWTRDETSIRYDLKTFPKQDFAINYVRRHNSIRSQCGKSLLHVFSRECHVDRHRYFVVEDRRTFY